MELAKAFLIYHLASGRCRHRLLRNVPLSNFAVECDVHIAPLNFRFKSPLFASKGDLESFCSFSDKQNMKCSFKDTNTEICILFSLPLLLGWPRIGFCRLQQALQDITIEFIIPNPSTIYNFYRIISAKVCGVIPTTMLSAMQTLVL